MLVKNGSTLMDLILLQIQYMNLMAIHGMVILIYITQQILTSKPKRHMVSYLKKTKHKEATLISCGYTIISIWESDFDRFGVV